MPTNRKGKPVLLGCGALVAVLVIIFIVMMFFGAGRRMISTVWHGNVYSVGYRDVYVCGASEKVGGITGLGRVYEMKATHQGFGAPVDPTKLGQTPQGAWTANFMDDSLYTEVQKCRGDLMYRVFYKEKDFQFEGATNYEVLGIIALPPPGEPMDDVIAKGRQLLKIESKE
jgi:hypothetical protein